MRPILPDVFEQLINPNPAETQEEEANIDVDANAWAEDDEIDLEGLELDNQPEAVDGQEANEEQQENDDNAGEQLELGRMEGTEEEPEKEEGWAEDVEIAIEDDVVGAQEAAEGEKSEEHRKLSKEEEVTEKIVDAGAGQEDGWAHEEEIDLGNVLDEDAMEQQDE